MSMPSILLQVVYYFVCCLEYVLIFYIILTWIPCANQLKNYIQTFFQPCFNIAHKLLEKSIFKTHFINMAPLIVLIVMEYVRLTLYEVHIGG